MNTQESLNKSFGHRSVQALLLFVLALGAEASTLKDVTFESRPDGTTDIRLVMDEAPVAPKVFATEAPPRLAIDLDATNNAVADRRINVGSGAASTIAIVEAGGRTRVVVELFHPTTHSSRIEGNSIILTVGADSSVAQNNTANAAAGSQGWTEKPVLQAVDFRRGNNGEGRIVVNFNRDGAGSDIRKEGSNRVVVDLYDVSLADDLPLKLDVTDFATLVSTIETQERAGGARLVVSTTGAFDHMAYQTGDQFVIEVSKKREVEEGAQRRKPGEAMEYKGTPVTFNFQDIPVRTLLQLIADISEFNIVVADSVQGNITLRMVNTPWDQALAVVLQAKGLDQRREGGVIWVAPTAEIAQREQALEDARIAIEDRQSLVSEYIAINYGKAKEIAVLLTDNSKQGAGQKGGAQSASSGFLSKRGSVTFDDRTNTLLISDIPERISDLKALISILDRPVDQVLIESRIVVANETFGKEIGARFGVTSGYEDHNGNVITTSGSVAAANNMINQALVNRNAGRPTFPLVVPGGSGGGILSPTLENRLNVDLPASGAAPRLGLSILGADYLLDLELSALQEEGSGEVVANPRVITANQREAVIRQGDEIGYVTITTSGGAVPIPTVAFKEVLLELKVTPTITQDDRIFLNMAVKKDELTGFVSTSIGDVPQINKRELNTAVLVENGQTVVLGGVYEYKSRRDLQKTPFLGDLPLLGNLFKTQQSSSDKAELLIFVTPKILRQRGAGK
ncbi:type IV pilus secretin PilQ [Ahniella affigens]|uniref:Type IV pilus secretin PilQ n=1 Tax=Ahniella affigens TaxID=2021234 RepID=A0A2P1PZ67_9GAMM|nr:type IV pilus secretin PilQ [Ahniella affigens]AVQ00153.1 type IV pilus secretin PilQ [Ahniella affigens]